MTMPMSSAVSFMFSFEFTDKNQELSLTTMAIRLVSFQTRGTQLERFLPKNQHTQRKFENWVNGEVSKIGHHFSEESDLKIDANKKCR